MENPSEEEHHEQDHPDGHQPPACTVSRLGTEALRAVDRCLPDRGTPLQRGYAAGANQLAVQPLGITHLHIPLRHRGAADVAEKDLEVVIHYGPPKSS